MIKEALFAEKLPLPPLMVLLLIMPLLLERVLVSMVFVVGSGRSECVEDDDDREWVDS